MFNDTKSLIVVYKDEMLLNELRKLVETKDDTAEGVVGVKDGSVKIVSWNEKMWLGQKKNGTINNKVLFIGDIKNTDQLIPILDVKFDKYGVMYGWAGNQAVLTCDPKKLGSAEYQEFLKDIESLDIPEAIKKATEELQKPLYELSAAAYQQAQASGAQQGAQAGAENAQGAQQQKKDDDDVVDADYTEVKDDKK